MLSQLLQVGAVVLPPGLCVRTGQSFREGRGQAGTGRMGSQSLCTPSPCHDASLLCLHTPKLKNTPPYCHSSWERLPPSGSPSLTSERLHMALGGFSISLGLPCSGKWGQHRTSWALTDRTVASGFSESPLSCSSPLGLRCLFRPLPAPSLGPGSSLSVSSCFSFLPCCSPCTQANDAEAKPCQLPLPQGCPPLIPVWGWLC